MLIGEQAVICKWHIYAFCQMQIRFKHPENALVQEPEVERSNKWQEIKFKFISFETIQEILFKYFF